MRQYMIEHIHPGLASQRLNPWPYQFGWTNIAQATELSISDGPLQEPDLLGRPMSVIVAQY